MNPSLNDKLVAGMVSSPNTDPNVLNYIERMPHLPITAEDVQKSTPSTSDANGVQTVSTMVNETVNFTDVAALSPNAGELWPGALIQGSSLRGGTLAGINVGRMPLHLTLSPLGDDTDAEAMRRGPVRLKLTSRRPLLRTQHIRRLKESQPHDVTVPDPSAGSVEAARVGLLQNGFAVPTQVAQTYSSVFSLEDALLKIHADASYLTASISGNLSTEDYSSSTNKMVVFTQKYYDLSADDPSSPSSLFDSTVHVNNLQPYSDRRGNPITFVKSVTYGRMAILLISSKVDESSLQADINATLSGLGYGGDIAGSISTQKLRKESHISLLMLGGSGRRGLTLVRGGKSALTNLNNWLSTPMTAKDVQLGVPISYRVNYLKDNQAATLSYSTNFTTVQQSTLPYLTNWQIKFDTTDDDKDGNTHLSVQVYGLNDTLICHYDGFGGRNGNQYTYNNGSTNVLSLTPDPARDADSARASAADGVAYAKDAGAIHTKIHIDPDGRDKWHFNYTLTATDSSGQHNYIRMGHMELSHDSSNREGWIR